MITDVKHIIIKKSILHIIDKSTSHYNNYLLPHSDEFDIFLIKHIRASARTKARKTATFLHRTVNSTLNYSSNLFADDTSFIDSSKKLAEKLAGICTIKNHGPYDFIICQYINDDEEDYVALILLESTTGFFHQIINKSTDAIIKELTIFASSNSNLKKCALIPHHAENLDYDLLINDKNLSDFFLTDFLCSELYMDNKKATETFIEKTIEWVNEKCADPTINLETKELLEEVKSECISSLNNYNSIDIEAFEDNLFRDSLEIFKDDYDKKLENAGLIDRQIVFSNNVKDDYKYQKIKLDNDTELKIPVVIINNNAYNQCYNKNVLQNGEYKFTLQGKIMSETVKSR